MITRLLIIATFLLKAAITNSQILISPIYTAEEVGHFRASLIKKIEDTTRMDFLLKLAAHNLRKAPYEKDSPDSAADFVRLAKNISAGQRSAKHDGRILLYESSLAIKRGHIDTGQKLAVSAIRLLQNSADEFHLTLAYLELSRCYNPNRPAQEIQIKKVFDTLFQLTPSIIDRKEQERCMSELVAFYHMRLQNDPPSIRKHFLNHLVRSYRVMKDKLGEFWARKEITDIHFQQGETNKAIVELLEIEKEQKAGRYDRICYTYDLLAGFYMAAGNHAKALHYAFETLKNVKTYLDSFYLSLFIARVAAIYSATGSTAEAVEWNLKRLNHLIAINETQYVYTHLDFIITDLIALGRGSEALKLVLDKTKRVVPAEDREKRSMFLCLAKCYAAVGNRVMAERYCEQLIKINELRVNRKEISSDPFSDSFLASFYISIGQYKKAEKYFNRAIEINPGSINRLDRSYLSFKLDSAKGNYLSAIKRLQNFHFLNDSIFTETKSKQVEELKVAYETEKKEDSIRAKNSDILVLTQKNQLQQANLKQASLIKNVTIVGIILAFVIIGLIYRQYRLKQRSNNLITHKNEQLQHFLTEKEWLLKEIHHRVKNNLQIVMSLLNSQSAYIDNEPALTAIHDSQHRVHAMSLIHQKLYNSENLSTIDMSIYVRELVSYLSESFVTGQRIRFELNVEPLELDVSQAVPLGLILNEAITNSIKYAFPDNRNGAISISLSNPVSLQYLLVISDNGIGIPSYFKNTKAGSLGMSLMEGLTEDLGGTFSIENNNGTIITISFVHEQTVHRLDILNTSSISNN